MRSDAPVERGVGERIGAQDDAAIVHAARRDPSAFEPLYERYHPGVYHYLRLRTATVEEAADLTQQVFLQALAALPKYRERGLPFAAWLFRIAGNVATDAHRRRRPALDWDLVPERLRGISDDDPEAAALANERVERLRQHLATLDPAKRELLGLRFAAGLSSGEIAAVVGKSEAAVKKQLTRIIQQLREQYGDA